MISIKEKISIFLLSSCALICLYSTQPVLENISLWGHVDISTAAYTISATTLGVAIFSPVSGIISDRYGRKITILCAILTLLIITGISIISWNIVSLLIFRFLQGVTIPFIFPSTVAFISEQWVNTESARLNSIYVAGTAFGGFSGRFFPSLSVELSGYWKSTFIVLSLILALILASFYYWIPKEKNFIASYSYKESMYASVKYLKNKSILITCFIAFVLLFQQVASFTFGSLLLSKAPFNLNSIQIGLIFVVFLAPSLVTPIIGIVIDRFYYVIAMLLTCICGISGLLLTLTQDTTVVIIGLTLSCISVFWGQACGTSFIAKNAQTNKSSAVGLYLFFYYLGGCFGAIIPAFFYKNWGWDYCVYLIIAMIILNFILANIGWKSGKFRYI